MSCDQAQAAILDRFIDRHPEIYRVPDISVGIDRAAGGDQQGAVTHDPAPERLIYLDTFDFLMHKLTDSTPDDARFEYQSAVGHAVIGPDHYEQ